MSPESSQDERDRLLLRAIGTGAQLTQRSLAKELGVALGLTNLLIRRLVAKGYVRATGVGTRHVKYLMTGAGWEALASLTKQSLENTVQLYTQTRDQIGASLELVSRRCAPDDEGRKSVVFYGAGDVAEIAYVSLQRTDLSLVGVVDDRRTGRFFGLEILSPEVLDATSLGAVRFSHLVVTSVRYADIIRNRVEALGVPPARVSGIETVPAAPADLPFRSLPS